MFYKILLWLFAMASYFLANVHTYEMNMTSFFQMPKLYDFDGYDRCLQEFDDPSTYCFVRAEVLPEANSTAWQTIVEFSKYDRHHFNHSQLYYGICISWCEATLSKLNASTLDELYAGILTNNSKVNTYRKLFSMEEENRQRFNRIINQCINLRLNDSYGLRALTMVEYCDTNHKSIETDPWNFTFYVTVAVLVLFAALSSLYDFFLKRKENDNFLRDHEHYTAPPNGIAQRFGVVFSIPRNWYRLNQVPNGKLGNDLRFLDCFKFFSMFLVIFAHTNWVIYEGAIDNPQDPERLLHTTAGTYLLAGSLITTTFFVISGFLLTLNWLAVTKVKTELTGLQYVGLYLVFNIFRYIRLMGPYMFAILLSGVYFENPGGPMWRHVFEREQLSCRKNWWTNLLYINNYVNNNERCLLQGWYLAADTHAFIISLLLLMIAHKWPKAKKYLFGTVMLLAHIIPGVITYVMKYTPVFMASPQTQRDSFIDYDQFTHFYAPVHMNFGCYFAGVLAGLIYDEMSDKQFNLRKYKSFQIIWYALLPIGAVWMSAAHPLYQNYYEDPPLLLGSIFAAIQRNSWACGLALIIIGMAGKVGWIFRRFACMPIFRVLGRLTYGVFVLHLLIIRTVLATIREPIYFGTGMMFAFIIFTVTVTYLLSFLLTMFLELPVSSLLKTYALSWKKI